MKMFVLVLSVLTTLCLGIYDMKRFDLNHWNCVIMNDGRLGFDPARGAGGPGGSWPQPLKNCYIFGAGPWVGIAAGPDTLVTVGYNPNSGGTEFVPTLCRYWREGTGDSLDRVYKYPGDWPPPQGRFPMSPQLPRSDMDLWCCYGDSNPEMHISPGRPLGADVYLTVYGFSDSLARDFFFLKYELANFSGSAYTGVYFGVAVDADIGDHTDDGTGLLLNRLFRVGSDTFRVRNTGFFFDWDNIEVPGENWESGTPGAVALMLLRAPGGLGLTAFKKFTIEVDPVTDRDQYLTMAGYDYRTGAYEPYDSVDLVPGDKRALFATGPFNLAPDSVATFYYAVIGAPFGEPGQPPEERDTTELALRCRWAERFFVEHFAGTREGRQSLAPGYDPVAGTIVRGVLRLPRCMGLGHDPKSQGGFGSCPAPALLDVTGRRVMELVPGENDVRHLAPGVYFVRQAQAQAVWKVVVQR